MITFYNIYYAKNNTLVTCTVDSFKAAEKVVADLGLETYMIQRVVCEDDYSMPQTSNLREIVQLQMT